MTFAALFMAASVATATLALAQKTFLSSDIVTGTVTVNNTSPYALRYFTACGIPFSPKYIYVEKGRTRIEPVEWTFSRCAGGTAIVAPGAQFSFPVNLLACEVHSDPCSQTLALQLYINPVGAARYTIATNEVSYSIAPDATATFEGVNRNRAVIITQGVGSETLTPTVGLESFTMSLAQASLCSGQGEVVDQLDRAFHSAGIETSGSYARNDPSCVIGIRVSDIADNAGRVPGAVERARTLLPGKIESYHEEYALDSSGGLGLEQAPRLDAMARAQKVAPVLGVVISSQSRLAGFDRGTLEDQRGTRSPVPLSWQDLIFAQAAPVRLTVRQDWGFVSDAPARLSAALLHAPADSEFCGNNAAPFAFKAGLVLKIAADRTQIFVIGAADDRSALRNGLDPTAAAITFATRRAKMVAQLIGLSARYYSAVEAYPPTFIGGDRYVYSAGVAMTLEGQASNSWRLPKGSAPFTFPSEPTASYVPIAVPDGDDMVAGDARATVLVRLPSAERLQNVERQVTKLALGEATAMASSAGLARHLYLKRLVLLIVSPLEIDGDPFAQTSVTLGQFFSVHVRVQAFFRAVRV